MRRIISFTRASTMTPGRGHVAVGAPRAPGVIAGAGTSIPGLP